MKLASVILEFIVSLHFYGCFYTFFRSYTNAPIRTNFITKQPMKALLFITSINLSYLYIYLAIGFFCASSFILILNTSTSVTSSLSPFFFSFPLVAAFFFFSFSFFLYSISEVPALLPFPFYKVNTHSVFSFLFALWRLRLPCGYFVVSLFLFLFVSLDGDLNRRS